VCVYVIYKKVTVPFVERKHINCRLIASSEHPFFGTKVPFILIRYKGHVTAVASSGLLPLMFPHEWSV